MAGKSSKRPLLDMLATQKPQVGPIAGVTSAVIEKKPDANETEVDCRRFAFCRTRIPKKGMPGYRGPYCDECRPVVAQRTDAMREDTNSLIKSTSRPKNSGAEEIGRNLSLDREVVNRSMPSKK